MAGRERDISVQVFNCPNCGAGVEVRAPGQSLSVVCKSCASIIDAANENHKILSKFDENVKFTPAIPLGTKGRIKGSLWQVIGFMVRTDGPGLYQWQEYLLFNPMKGFRWLMEAEGHWNYIKVSRTHPAGKLWGGREGTRFLGKKYYLFHAGTAKVKFVLGEFYWRVMVGDKTKVEDYICPPEILSREQGDEEVVWSIGEYVEPSTVEKAFSIEKMPRVSGVAPNQPSPAKPKATPITLAWTTFFCILFTIQMISVFGAANQTVFSSTYLYSVNNVPPHQTKKRFYDVISSPFELKHGITNVEVTLHSPVRNNWIEMSMELVNDKTDETYGFDIGVEYYFGSGWTEGSQTEDVTLSGIPEGTYHMNIRLARNTRLKSSIKYSIKVKRGVPLWSNFVIVAILLSLPLIFVQFRTYSFEVKRWKNSDYSPYHGEEE